jgi:signal transduction histidine kinase
MSDIIYISLLSFILLLALLAFTYGLYKVLNKKLDNEKRKGIQMVLDAQERERQAIGREVHDHLGPMLSIISMQAENIAETADELKTKSALFDIQKQLKETITACRDISHHLTPYLNDYVSLEQMLDERIRRIKTNSTIEIDFSYTCGHQNFQPPKAAAVFRIVSELLNNTIKHSGASKIVLHVQCNPQQLMIQYKDDGKGIASNEQNNGTGIRNMKSRAELLNGLWKQPTVAKGYAVDILLPLKELIIT